MRWALALGIVALVGCTLIHATYPRGSLQAVIVGQGDVAMGSCGGAYVGTWIRAANYTDQVTILGAFFSAAATAAAAYFGS
jgi:hypothetical protein